MKLIMKNRKWSLKLVNKDKVSELEKYLDSSIATNKDRTSREQNIVV